MASLFHRRSASSATSTTSSSSLNSPGEGGSGSSSSLFKRPLLNKSFFGSKSSNLSSQTPSDNSFDILLQSGETILLSLSNNGSTTDTSLELDQPPAALGPDDENDPSNHLVDLLKAENVRLNLQVVKLREELAVSRGESLSSLTLPTIDDNLLASLTSAAGPGPLGPGSESGDASPLMPSTDAGSAPSVDWEAQYMELKERSNKLAQQAVITIEDRMKRIQHLEGENGALFDRCQTLAYEILERDAKEARAMSLIPRLVESIKRLHQDLQTERARHAVNDEFDRLRLHVTDRARPTSQLLGTPSAAATLNAEHERIERERRELQARAERLRVERDRLKVLQAAQDEAVATNQVGGPLDFAPGGSASAGATAVSTPPPALHGSGGGHYQHHTGAGAGAPVSPIITTPLLYSPDMHSHLHHQQPVSATQVSTPTGMAPPPVLVSPGGLLLTPLSTTAPHPTGPSAAGPHAGGPSSHLATAPDHLSGSHLASPSSATPPLQYSNSAHSLSLASTPEPGSSPGMSSPTGAAACPESNFARSDSSINERAHHHAYGSADANATGGTAVPLSPFAPMAGTESNFRASIDCSSQSFSQLRSTFGG